MALVLATPSARAQFEQPGQSSVRERLTGEMLSAEGAPTPEAGDQVAAFFQGEVVGLFTFTSETSGRQFSFVVFGDNPSTSEVDGPRQGDRVEFRFFDSSANQVRTDIRVENTQGEAFNYRYGGEEVPPILDDLPIPIDLTPTRNINLRLGVQPGGGGGGGGEPSGDFDVNGDGTVDKRDAALVLRIISGASRGVSSSVVARADVNGDGVVNTQDAIDILRNR